MVTLATNDAVTFPDAGRLTEVITLFFITTFEDELAHEIDEPFFSPVVGSVRSDAADMVVGESFIAFASSLALA